ncbi:MAG TPA: class I SAM-dependent methyltransferase [Opitutaceae bacterium]|jgi:ubiquinone/menaquinone biosynthesis C-methylase UbiE
MRIRYDKNAFSGTSEYYLKYRLPYPEALLLDLLARVKVAQEGRLLDLACGPGRIALAMAPWFREVWAVDVEAEMIDAGRTEAARRGIENVRWSVGRAEELEAPYSSFDLVTVGEAFHRLDQLFIARQCLRWLKPGGGLGDLGVYTILSAKEPWERIVTDVVNRWTGRDASLSAAGVEGAAEIGPKHDEAVLREAGFLEAASYSFVVRHRWNADTVLGYLYSTSVCSRRVLGDRAAAFDSEVRSALLAHDASDEYWEDMRFGYTFGRRPA